MGFMCQSQKSKSTGKRELFEEGKALDEQLQSVACYNLKVVDLT